MINNVDLAELHNSGLTYSEIGERYHLNPEAVRGRIKRLAGRLETARPVFAPVSVSSMPVYDKPLTARGDALILADVEAPFHCAEFLNRVLDLAYAWHIPTCILAGDALHFDSFSHWEANWKAENKPGDNLTPETAELLRMKIQELPTANQAALLEVLGSIPVDRPECDELTEARRVLETLGQMFSQVDFILGNHDSRFLHALNSPLLPRKLLDFIGGCPEPKWRIAPYYYSILESGGRSFRVEHPKAASISTPIKLADKFEADIICGHSHLLSVQWSTSGKHWAIAAGHIVDEMRLPYASQRSTNRPHHALGAVILRDGYPYILHDLTQWERLKQMK